MTLKMNNDKRVEKQVKAALVDTAREYINNKEMKGKYKR